jgi:pyruvate carboxylase subunit B
VPTKFKLMLDGVAYDVERRGDLVLVNGLEFPVKVEGATVHVNGTPHAVDVTGQTARYDGIGYAVQTVGLEEPKPAKVRKAASQASADEAGAVTAIMPGLIIKVLVKEGDRVQAGDTVMVLEAMKMQNELHAKQSGTVRAINVKAGESVEMRQVLAIIE